MFNSSILLYINQLKPAQPEQSYKKKGSRALFPQMFYIYCIYTTTAGSSQPLFIDGAVVF